MSCRIFFVRHGETTWNVLLKLQGHSDVALSDRGREQAELLSQRLAAMKIDCLYSSDLTRACETAEIIAGPHALKVNKESSFREFNFGIWEGLTIEEVKKDYTGEIKQWWANPMNTRIPGGEMLSEVVERSTIATKKIIDRHNGETVLIVAHGGVIRSIIGSVLGLNLNEHWRLHLDNTGMSLLDFPRWEHGTLKLFNDCAHLKNRDYLRPKNNGTISTMAGKMMS
ncbi:MAG: alpha-ribazole phosphatase [Desulfotomaculaceae bacterium]|nr:alpha-ribazole phosphatase [Desulfotomaculaceae bacterium]